MYAASAAHRRCRCPRTRARDEPRKRKSIVARERPRAVPPQPRDRPLLRRSEVLQATSRRARRACASSASPTIRSPRAPGRLRPAPRRRRWKMWFSRRRRTSPPSSPRPAPGWSTQIGASRTPGTPRSSARTPKPSWRVRGARCGCASSRTATSTASSWAKG